ncbi:MAG: ORC1-type DNA replication protein [Thaumarchaeota archaeon]|jgi:cell division control protein 6|nr:ORC1-type DNA replication protein [Candidatus Geocrenenecus arthurdayi]MCL7388322.1 ORC1-type DNA replication protein [Candidatus Geocrenenecus arthurdayi]MCL7390480.1 ORC1-type DNA replication protein [Candidatus Geocrenenecus arthurdayi]MCL7395929.1 ORC1-type DNA replication protein [Candidatus Geocrenenecus arthurdayi]MCL7401532.1 ORC1-type DNA replication protein [Candidatus Geocrenenecus arthurdayi]
MKIFKDEEKLSPEYVPPNLPHRENELNMLKTFFSSVIDGTPSISTRVIVSGSVGTGKSALVKLFGQKAVSEASKKGVDLKFLYVNCRISKTTFSVLRKLIEQLKARLPERGLSNEEFIHKLLDHLEYKGSYAILALDEVEMLLREEGSEPFYLFSRVGEERLKIPRISTIFIFRNPEILDTLDASTRSSLLGNIIHLKEYDYSQLYDIVKYRASLAFRPDVLMEDAIQLIADIASERGDARYALDILWRAGKYAEAENASQVAPEHVRKAAASVYPTIRREHLEFLEQHSKLILLALAQALDIEKSAYVTSSILNDYYKMVCEEYDVEPRSYTSFWEALQRLDDLGIIKIRVVSEGSKGRKSYISLPGIPTSILKKELIPLLPSKQAKQ